METQYDEPYSMKFHKFMIYFALPVRILLEVYDLITILANRNNTYAQYIVIILVAMYCTLMVLDLCAEVSLIRRRWGGVKLFSISLTMQIVINTLSLLVTVKPGASVLYNLIFFASIILVGVWLYAFRKYYGIRHKLFQ